MKNIGLITDNINENNHLVAQNTIDDLIMEERKQVQTIVALGEISRETRRNINNTLDTLGISD